MKCENHSNFKYAYLYLSPNKSPINTKTSRSAASRMYPGFTVHNSCRVTLYKHRYFIYLLCHPGLSRIVTDTQLKSPGLEYVFPMPYYICQSMALLLQGLAVILNI